MITRDFPRAPRKSGGTRPLQATILWLAVLGALLLPGMASAQTVNPLEADPRAAAAGGSLYRAQCATCHGADAAGIQDIQAPDLTSLWSRPGRTDASVFQTIRNGIPGSIMPPHSFTDTETWMLVSYLKSLDAGSNREQYAGDAERGAELYDSYCRRCHRVNSSGGSLGPALDRITASRSKTALQQAIRDPGTSMARGYRPVRVVTGDRRQYRGTIKSEDAFSLQIMDESENLRGFRKSDLISIQYEDRSLMPRFTPSALSDGNLENILTFLAGAADPASH